MLDQNGSSQAFPIIPSWRARLSGGNLGEKFYTLKEAKKLLGVTTRTIQRWDKEW